MPVWTCRACAVEHADSPAPPATCAICSDDRQYVRPSGQRWTTPAELARRAAAAPSTRSSPACWA